MADNGHEISYFGEDRYYFPHRHAHVIVVAEKGAESTSEKTPIQFGYRPGLTAEELDGRGLLASHLVPTDSLDPYFRSALRFFRSPRPPIVAEAEKVRLPDYLFLYDPRVIYCGSILPLAQTSLGDVP